MEVNRRRLLQWVLGVSALGLSGFLPKPLGAMVRPGMRSLKGDVSINGRAARLDQIIQPGDHISTGMKGEAVFIVGADAFLMRGDSELMAPVQSNTEQALTVISGKILSVFGKKNLRIDTPLATVGIRGTGAYVEVYPDHDYICLCYGKADMRSKVDPGVGKILDTFHHDAPQEFYADQNRPGGLLMKAAPMVNHLDEELIMLEALVGRVPLFGPKPIKMP